MISTMNQPLNEHENVGIFFQNKDERNHRMKNNNAIDRIRLDHRVETIDYIFLLE